LFKKLEAQALTKKSSPRSSLSRREFGQRVALATAGAGIASSARADGHSRLAEASAQDDRAVAKLSAEGRVRFESMWQNVLRKHGDRLTADQKTRMRKIIASNVTMLETIYAVPVRNGDAPATTLRLAGPASGKN
jgi:hypothetical protein